LLLIQAADEASQAPGLIEVAKEVKERDGDDGQLLSCLWGPEEHPWAQLDSTVPIVSLQPFTPGAKKFPPKELLACTEPSSGHSPGAHFNSQEVYFRGEGGGGVGGKGGGGGRGEK
jgi:hypothetical protein